MKQPRVHVLRQGDVLLIPTHQQPSAKAKPVADQGRTILAYGEQTGHCHEVITTTAAENADPVPAQQLFEEPDGTRLLVMLAPGEVRHDEHAPIALEVGGYQVIRQCEWSLDDVRQVAD